MRVSDEHYQAIGRVCVSLSTADVWISGFIWRLISHDWGVGQIITAEMSFRNKLNILYSLLAHRISCKEEVEIFNKQINSILTIEHKINQMIHANWLVESTNIYNITRFKITAKRWKSYLRREMKPHDIQKMADEFDTVLEEFIDGMEQTLGALADKTLLPKAISFRYSPRAAHGALSRGTADLTRARRLRMVHRQVE